MVRLTEGRLQLAAGVWNPGAATLPFGLGYHPYFSVPLLPGTSEAEHRLESPARSWWELVENLPIGKRGPADAAHSLMAARSLAGLNLDDAYGDLPAGSPLIRLGSLQGPRVRLDVLASPDFRDVVVFTPPHRRAVCLEPYTCITDAVNLQARGIDAGWRSLAPGAQWLGVVEIVCRAPE
jgi:aldose 1-epimerase